MIVAFEDVGARDLARVGGKGANLGELVGAGMPVPPGFCVEAGAYRAAVTGRWPRIAELLERDPPDGPGIRRLVDEAPVPDGLEAELTAALDRLGGGPVAVRSSATAEDLPGASFAGQQDTVLGVVGARAVLAAVRRCWASLWTDRAISYREQRGYRHADVALAVVVQRMVPAAVSGVLFTVDPVTGRADDTVIDASWGLGESVVSGAVTPDSFRVRGGRIVERVVGAKQTRVDLTPAGGTTTEPVAAADRARACLADDRVLALAGLGERVAAHYGRPQDLEWAVTGGGALWLLQSRPVTGVVGGEPGPGARSTTEPATELTTRSTTEPATELTTRSTTEPAVDRERAAAGWLSRWLHDDILEHFPAPYPLDLAVVAIAHRTLLRAMRTHGLRVADTDLVTVDDDGVARAGYPRWRLGGLRAAWRETRRADRIDPGTWATGPGPLFDGLTRALAGVDVSGLAGPELAAHLERLLAVAEDLQRERFADYLGSYARRGVLLDLVLRGCRLPGLTQYDFLAGLDYATAVIDRGLRSLAAAADGSPAVRAALLASPPDPDAVRRADPAWWAGAETFLAAYGARATKLYLPFSNRSWREDPVAFLATVAAVLRSIGTSDQAPAGAAERERVMAAAARRVPARWWPRFARLVEDYRTGHVVREGSVMQMEELLLVARAAALEAGRRLVGAGELDDAADVKYLTMDELLGWLRAPSSGLRGPVQRRRRARPAAEAAWWAGAHQGDVGSDALTGAPGSPGRVTGPARLVTGPADFARLQPGEVLVCRFTDPSWTPLFALAAGVVADTGGRLSHAAIVAREYGIPAVLGVGDATARLTDGTLVTVDGTRGRVTMGRPGPVGDHPPRAR